MMNDLIREYLIISYLFSTDDKSWCVIDRICGKVLSVDDLIRKFERIFPNMGSNILIRNWWVENVEINTNRINSFLSNYKLVDSGASLFNWKAVSKIGHRDLKIDDLMKILPSHFRPSAIELYYDEWIYNKRVEETENVIYGKYRYF